MAWKRKRRGFGRLRAERSGRLSASYKGPDGVIYKAPHTFHPDDEWAAENWLRNQEDTIRAAELAGVSWVSPQAKKEEEQRNALTVRELIDLWLSGSTAIKKESTRQTHRRKLEARVLLDSFDGFDSLADLPVVEIDRQRIKLWWSQVQANWPEQGATNAAAYKRLRTAFAYAVEDLEIIDVNPVNVRGAATAPRSATRDRDLVTLAEARALVKHSSDRLKVPVLILEATGLRLGELLELRRKDIIKKDGVMTLRIHRNAVRVQDPKTKKQIMVSQSTPKTSTSIRDIEVPDNVAVRIREHLEEFVAKDKEALIVTTKSGKRMMDTTFRSRFKEAAKAAGRPDITPHDLRRYYGTMLVTNAGASLEEARQKMGHSSVEQLMEYQRASKHFGKKIADNLNNLFPTEDETK